MKKNKSLAITILMITMLIILSTKVQASTGTVEGETVNVRKETIEFYASPTQLKRNKDNGYVVVRIDDDEREE